MSDAPPDGERSLAEGGDGQSDGGSSGFAFSRRTLLRTGAGLTAVAGLAGCGDPLNVTSYSFDAVPAVLESSPEDPTYDLRRMRENTVERTPTVLGTEVDIKITNQGAIYDGDLDTVGLLSSPTATVATEPRNPLATDSVRDVLVGPEGDRLLAALDVIDRDSVAWTRGPEVVRTGSGELLGERTEVQAFAGLTEESGFLLLTVARVTDAGDVVFAANAQQRHGDAARLVGADGYVEPATVSASVDRLERVLPRVKRGGAGIKMLEAARLTSEADRPDHVRVLLANQYDQRTLYGIRVTAQLFDDRGDLLTVETANVCSLGPDEQFEGYVPYVAEDVAGYGVDGSHSSRDVTVGPSASATVTDHSRDGDTVTVGVRNGADATVPFVSLEVTFYDDAGNVISRDKRSVANLAAGERREYDVVYAPAGFLSPAAIADYSVELLEYTGDGRYVR